ncbi:hypothetical protein GBA52_000580, partial [Prunus armeniaca]
TMLEMEQSRKMVNQESFLRQMIEKANEQLKKQRKEMARVLFHSLIVQLQGTVARRIQDGSITLTVKFLHFFIARFLQFRHSSPVQPPPYSTSMLFWVAVTRSVSSTSDLSL